MAASSSPTVGRRRLAAELRRLRGGRTGGAVAKSLGWSPAKISRYELGQGGFPLDEIEKLLDFYAVAEPRRTQLMSLAEDANRQGWWEDYGDAISPGYMEFIGLEAEAASLLHWQVETVPGLLQTEEYALRIHAAVQRMYPTPPGVIDRRVEVRMTRQRVMTERMPPLELSVVLDESALLRHVGGSEVMRAQLRHLAQMAKMPNIHLRIRPLRSKNPIMAVSFVVFGFSPEGDTAKLGDVVSTENLTNGELYIEGESDTYRYRLFFDAVCAESLSCEESMDLITRTAEQVWS